MKDNVKTVECQIGRREYEQLYYLGSCRYTKKRLRALTVAAFVIAAVVLALTLGLRLIQDGLGVAAAAGFLFMGVYLVSYPAVKRASVRRRVAREYDKGGLSDTRRLYGLDDEGVYVEGGSDSFYFKWDEISQIRAGGGAYLLVFRRFSKTCLLPERYLTDAHRALLPKNKQVIFP